MILDNKALLISTVKRNEELIDKYIDKQQREECKFIKSCIQHELNNLNDTNNRLIALLKN